MGLTLLIFLTVTLTVVAAFQVLASLWSGDARRVQQRLADEFGKGQDQAAQSALFPNLERLSLDQPPASLDLEKPDNAPPSQMPADLGSRLQTLLEQANVNLAVRRFVLITGCLGFAVGMAGTLWCGPLVGIPAAALAAAAPLLYVHIKRNARREKFLQQLPNAFELMARVLRAGHSVPQAMQAVAESFDDPLAGEFGDCQQQLNLGLRPEITFQEMAQRSGVVEMRIFVMALLIQRQTGGNLSEMLERLAGLVRARIRLRNQVRTLTAEGRMQGLTLTVLPFLMFGVMMVVNRNYAEALLQHGSLLAATLAVMSIGVLWIRQITKVDY